MAWGQFLCDAREGRLRARGNSTPGGGEGVVLKPGSRGRAGFGFRGCALEGAHEVDRLSSRSGDTWFTDS